jgi:hypothetical protein
LALDDASGKSDTGRVRDARNDAAPTDDGPATISDAAADDDAAPCTPDLDATVTCVMNLPPDNDCPNTTPSYAMAVAPIIARRCTACHRPGGAGAPYEFDTYAKIAANSNMIHMVTQVYTCRMPPASCADPLTADEKWTLLQWLVCGGPNN